MTEPGPDVSDLTRLRRRLDATGIVFDVPALVARWKADGREGDDEAFIAWVLATQAEEQVLVTEILPPRLTDAREPTISTDATLIETPLDGEALEVTVIVSPEAVATPREPGADRGRSTNARYVIVGEAGKGGMAVVHVARDIDLMRSVALKRLAGSLAVHQGVQARFLREVQISAQLDHPNIVPIYGLEIGPDGVPAYAMKLVRGKTLDEFLKETRALHERDEPRDESHDLPARLEHFLKVCDAMAYAHDKGVVHRDLKPANVMIGHHNEIYVMDWGICRVMRLPESQDAVAPDVEIAGDDDADSRTQMGSIVGTARYMSPEQAQGQTERVGPAADQYSLGLILFEIATLKTPYEGRTVVEVLAQAARGDVRPVQHAYPGQHVPVEIAAIIGRATALDPSKRYSHVRALAADIRRYLRGDEVEARPDTLWQKGMRSVARHRQLVLTSLVALVALTAIVTAGLLYRHDRAIVAARDREQAMLGFVDHVTSRAALLQTRLLELQSEIDVLASTAALALQSGTPSNAPFYWADDFDVPARRPPDFVAGPDGVAPESSTYAAWIPAIGADRQRLAPVIQRLQNARQFRNDLFQRARRLFGTDVSGAGAGELRGAGIEAFMTGLAAGVTMHLPGRSGLPRTSDPRQEPWYRLAIGYTNSRWGEPYALDSGRLVIPLSQVIRTDDAREVGVTSVLLSLEFVVRNLLADARTSAVRATILLDPQGRIIAASGELHPGVPVDRSLLLQTFPESLVLAAADRRSTGYATTNTFGQPDVVGFAAVEPMGWTLMKVAGEGAILAHASAGVSP